MTVDQREARGAVIEDSPSPGRNRVAQSALRCRRWESRRHVVWNAPAHRRGALERGLVAPVAIRRIQRVVVAHMARNTGCRRGRRVCSR